MDHVTEMPQLPAPQFTPRDALARIQWLNAVAAGTLDRLASQAVLHRMPAGGILFEQSETPAFAQLLIGGRVDLIAVRGADESLLEIVEPDDLLLPAAVLNRQPYLVRARALLESHLLLIHAQVFREAVASDHALCLAVLACQAAQFRRQVKLAKNLRLRAADERVGCYLLRLLQDSDGRVRLPTEKRHIAWQLGMTRETFSRSLAAMPGYGISVSSDMIEVTDPAALRRRLQLDPLIDAPEPIVPLPLAQPSGGG